MNKEILITGGAGFIGNEIIKLINKKNITIVDKKKDKKIISKFKKNKIKYIQGDLKDKNFSKKIYKNVDIIFHLAAITKVPSTDVNLDFNKEIKIYNEAILLMKNLINNCNKN